MTATKKAAKKTARRVQANPAMAAPYGKAAKVERITEAQLFGTAPSAVFLDEATGVEIGGKPSEAELTPQQAAVLDAACELIQADLPKAHRSLADWIAEEATQGRFYGSLKAAEVGYALILGRRPGGAQ